MQKMAPLAILVFGISQTFAFIDWVMSITPHWYSTMFGVYFFAISAVLSLSVITLIFLWLRSRGFLSNIVTVEHYHDLGKLLYGFNIFWAYIIFSQYFLIWYANIPEETVWFAEHFKGNWNTVAIIISIGHFAIPFILFMSRHMKRNLKTNGMMMVWMVVMTIVELYWVIMPNISKDGVHVSIQDVVPFLAIGGIFFAVLFSRMKNYALVPEQDPRLKESINFINA